MGRTSIQISEELADDLHDRKNRGDSYEDVLWRLIEAAEGSAPDVADHDQETDDRPDQSGDVAAWVGAINPGRLDDILGDVGFPNQLEREACLEAVAAAYGYLQESRSATMRDFVRDVMPEYPLGYEVPELAEGERFRGAWWRHVVKPGLAALPDVRQPGPGQSEWRIGSE